MSLSPSPPPLPPDLRARILAATRAEPAPTRADTRRLATHVALVAVVASIVVFAGLGGMRFARPASVIAVTGLGTIAAAAMATWGAVARGRSMLGRSRAALIGIAVGAPVALLAWATLATALDAGPVLAGGTTAQHAICFVLTAVYSFAPFAAVAYVRRGSDPVHPRALGAALGAAAGAWGGVLIDVHCPLATVEHLALGHALPVVAFALVGVAIGARVLGVRAVKQS